MALEKVKQFLLKNYLGLLLMIYMSKYNTYFNVRAKDQYLQRSSLHYKIFKVLSFDSWVSIATLHAHFVHLGKHRENIVVESFEGNSHFHVPCTWLSLFLWIQNQIQLAASIVICGSGKGLNNFDLKNILSDKLLSPSDLLDTKYWE